MYILMLNVHELFSKTKRILFLNLIKHLKKRLFKKRHKKLLSIRVHSKRFFNNEHGIIHNDNGIIHNDNGIIHGDRMDYSHREFLNDLMIKIRYIL